MECFTCEFTQDLSLFTTEFAIRGAAIFYDALSPIAKYLLKITIILMGIRLGVDRSYQSQFFLSFQKMMLFGFVVAFVLSSPLIVQEYVLMPMQAFAIEFAETVIDTFSPAGAAQTPSEYTLYTKIVYKIEFMVQWVVLLAIRIIDGASFLNLEIFQRFFGALFLLAPWAFIIILQGLFMVEAAFVFALAGILTPLLATVAIVPQGRPYVVAMIRILAGAMLTVMISAVVISFTGFAVQKHQAQVRAMLNPSDPEKQDKLELAKKEAELICDQVPTINPLFKKSVDQWFDIEAWKANQQAGEAAREKCNEAKQKVADIADPPFRLFDPYFMKLVIIGCISILLHLKSRTWASNLTGVQDGAGPAAAVASVVTGAAGVGLAMSKTALFKTAHGGSNVSQNVRSQFSSNTNHQSPFGGGGHGPSTGDPLRSGAGDYVSPVQSFQKTNGPGLGGQRGDDQGRGEANND